jgi:hypothetical protein
MVLKIYGISAFNGMVFFPAETVEPNIQIASGKCQSQNNQVSILGPARRIFSVEMNKQNNAKNNK